MTDARSEFLYVIYIRTTPEALWAALTTPDFMRRYWFGYHIDTGWAQGDTWSLRNAEGGVADEGEVLEFDPPRKLVLKWRHALRSELAAEGDATCTITLEPQDAVVKLSVDHVLPRPGSKLIEAVSGGWPRIFSNLKSLLEAGEGPIAQACFQQAANA